MAVGNITVSPSIAVSNACSLECRGRRLRAHTRTRTLGGAHARTHARTHTHTHTHTHAHMLSVRAHTHTRTHTHTHTHDNTHGKLSHQVGRKEKSQLGVAAWPAAALRMRMHVPRVTAAPCCPTTACRMRMFYLDSLSCEDWAKMTRQSCRWSKAGQLFTRCQKMSSQKSMHA
jgi:hypothetical protein